MNDIRRVLRVAAWRLGVTNFLWALTVLLAAGFGAAIALRLVEQILGFTKPEGLTSTAMWTNVAIWGGSACVVLALLWAVAARPRAVAVARRVDEGANLREAISTALCVVGKDDPWSRATVQSAAERARGVRVRQAVPIAAPRFWPVPLALGLSLVVVFIAMPRVDVLSWHSVAVAEQKNKAEATRVNQEVKELVKPLQDKAKELGLEVPKAEAFESEKPEAPKPDEIRKAAIKELTKLSDRLEQLKTGEKAGKLEAVKDQLKQLKQAGPETSDLSKALATGNFEKAKEELAKLKEAAAGSEMSESQKKEAAKQLEEIAKQLEQAAENKKDLEKQLEQAGIDSALASSPEGLKKALEQAPNLSQEQKDALAQQCSACNQASEAGKGLAEAMSKMAQGMKEGNSSKAGEGAQGAEGAMSELEQIAQEMAMADAALSECKSKMSELSSQCKGGQSEGMGECQGGMNGQWKSGWNQAMGEGSRGGPGQGKGGSAGEAKADHDFEKKMNIGAKGDGPIVSSRLVEGESVRGESRAVFARAAVDADQRATEAIENNTIPREYHDAIKTYFGRLKGKAGKGAEFAQPVQEVGPSEGAPKTEGEGAGAGGSGGGK